MAMKYKCVCKEEFENLKDFTKHAMNCKTFQRKQSEEAKERIKNET